MRSHSALYVDAGYLLSSAATRLTGSSLRRGIEVDFAVLIAALITIVEHDSELPLLRVYWYDAARDGKPTATQEGIALLPNVKLRLGRIGVDGEQKGVDLRIGLDMVGHSRAGRVDVMYLLSGDDDLSEAVEEAQAQGVQVSVLAVPSSHHVPHGVSRHLLYSADGFDLLDDAILDKAITPSRALDLERSTPSTAGPSPVAQPSGGDSSTSTPSRPSPATLARLIPQTSVRSSPSDSPGFVSHDPAHEATVMGSVAKKTYTAWSLTASPTQFEELRASRPSIPRDLDRALLVDLSDALSEFTLSDAMRVRVREKFWEAADGLEDAPSAE